MKTHLVAIALAFGFAGFTVSASADDAAPFQAGDFAVVKTDHAAVMAGEQQIGDVGVGREIRVERTERSWLLTTVTQDDGTQLRGWVSNNDVNHVANSQNARRFSFEPGSAAGGAVPQMSARSSFRRSSNTPLFELPKGDHRRWSNGQ